MAGILVPTLGVPLCLLALLFFSFAGLMGSSADLSYGSSDGRHAVRATQDGPLAFYLPEDVATDASRCTVRDAAGHTVASSTDTSGFTAQDASSAEGSTSVVVPLLVIDATAGSSYRMQCARAEMRASSASAGPDGVYSYYAGPREPSFRLPSLPYMVAALGVFGSCLVGTVLLPPVGTGRERLLRWTGLPLAAWGTAMLLLLGSWSMTDAALVDRQSLSPEGATYSFTAAGTGTYTLSVSTQELGTDCTVTDWATRERMPSSPATGFGARSNSGSVLTVDLQAGRSYTVQCPRAEGATGSRTVPQGPRITWEGTEEAAHPHRSLVGWLSFLAAMALTVGMVVAALLPDRKRRPGWPVGQGPTGGTGAGWRTR